MPPSAATFLEKYQLSRYDAIGKQPPNVSLYRQGISDIAKQLARSQGIRSRRKIRKMTADHLREFEEQRSRCPSKYEDPIAYERMSELAGEIQRVSEENLKDCPRWPLIGTAPGGQINAMTISLHGGDERVILFEDSLMIFDLLFTKAVALAFPRDAVERAERLIADGADAVDIARDERGAIMWEISHNPAPIHRFLQLIQSYAVQGDMSRTQQYVPEILRAHTANLLRESMRIFIFGHEFGHIVAGHFDDSDTSVRKLQGWDAEELEYAWGQEYDADLWGVHLAGLALDVRHQDPVFGAVGADLFFGAMDIMDRAVSTLRHGAPREATIGSHPPSTERRRYLRTRVVPDLYSPRDARRAQLLMASNEFIVEQLWDAVQPRFIELRDAGITASPQWR